MLIGVDICSNKRIQTTLQRSPFLKEIIFSPAEIIYCEQQANRFQHYAVRWAAKEALLKSIDGNILGTPLADIEVQHLPGGKPIFHLKDCILTEMIQRKLPGIPEVKIHLSLSHEDDYSIAFVIVAG